MTTAPALATPTVASERYQIMDVLRGFALFGVLVANLAELGGADLLATADQLAALPTAQIDAAISWALDLFVFDKANTLFAVLFGMGFWIQMERLSARGAPFGAIYRRRVTILAAFGLIHLFGWFSWDILHLYGLAAFVLFFSRGLSDRTLLWIGGALFLFGRPLVTWAGEATGLTVQAQEIAYAEPAVLARQAAAQSGDFFAFMAAMNHQVWLDWVVGGTFLAWFAYAIGRFYIGAWIARQGWVQNAPSHLPQIKHLAVPLLVCGLGLQIVSQWLASLPGSSLSGTAPALSIIGHSLATPMIAAGYVCALVLLFFNSKTRWLVRPFAPVGQMALTNYLLQSPFILAVLTGIGPGLALAGEGGSAVFLALSVFFFGLQIVASHVWMKAFAYGPAEWLWRGLTYRSFPNLRRQA